MAACHLEAHAGDWPSEPARLVVRWYVCEFLLLQYGDGLESRHATISARRYYSSRLTPDLPRWVHEGGQVGCGVGATSHARIHSSVSFFWGALQLFREPPCLLFFYFFVHFHAFCTCWRTLEKLQNATISRTFTSLPTLRSHTHGLGKSPMYVTNRIDG